MFLQATLNTYHESMMIAQLIIQPALAFCTTLRNFKGIRKYPRNKLGNNLNCQKNGVIKQDGGAIVSIVDQYLVTQCSSRYRSYIACVPLNRGTTSGSRTCPASERCLKRTKIHHKRCQTMGKRIWKRRELTRRPTAARASKMVSF